MAKKTNPIDAARAAYENALRGSVKKPVARKRRAAPKKTVKRVVRRANPVIPASQLKGLKMVIDDAIKNAKKTTGSAVERQARVSYAEGLIDAGGLCNLLSMQERSIIKKIIADSQSVK
jgi:hypothetical protein